MALRCRLWDDHELTMVDTASTLVAREFAMKEIAISKFKATCLAVLERVRKTGEPVLVTRFGHPVAEINPVGGIKPVRLGAGSGKMQILGDIVGPINDISEWEAASDSAFLDAGGLATDKKKK
jgi:prevent-host-death family protein